MQQTYKAFIYLMFLNFSEVLVIILVDFVMQRIIIPYVLLESIDLMLMKLTRRP